MLNTVGNWTSSYGSGSAGYISHFADAHPTFGEASYTVSGTVEDVALDSSGNVWYTARGSSNGTVGRISSTGIATFTPILVPSPLQPASIFIDGLNHVWVAAYNQTTQSTPDVLLEYSPTGLLLSPSGGYSANGTLSSSPGFPEGIAIDGSGNLWITGSFVSNNGSNPAKRRGHRTDRRGVPFDYPDRRSGWQRITRHSSVARWTFSPATSPAGPIEAQCCQIDGIQFFVRKSICCRT